MQAAASTAPACALRPHAKTHKSPVDRAVADRRAAPLASAAPSSARPKSSPTRESPTSGCPIRSTRSNAPRRARAGRPDARSRSSSTTRRWRAGGRARCDGAGREARRAGQGGRRVPSLRHRSRAATRAAIRRPSCRCRACGSAACSAMPDTGITPGRRAKWRHRARRGDVAARLARGAVWCEVEEFSVGATPTARYSLREDGLTEIRPGNYVVLRPHAGRTGIARRWTIAR